jgi:hypothetical protein
MSAYRAPVTTVDGVYYFCRAILSLTKPASQNKAEHLLGAIGVCVLFTRNG